MRPSKIKDSAAASPAAIQTFNFHGDELAVATVGGEHYVVLARLCEPLGLNVQAQSRKLRALSWAGVAIIATPSAAGGVQETICLSIRSVSGWLFTLNAGKVAPHLRKKLALYQRECADVLADHFLGRRASRADTADLSTAVAVVLDKVLAPVMAAIAAQNDRLAAVEERIRDSGILAPEKVSAIKARAASCAADIAKVGLEKRRAASLRIHKRLKMRVGWYGDRCRLDNMPARHEPEIIRELEIIEHETRGKVESARQLKLPHLTVIPGNANAAKKSG